MRNCRGVIPVRLRNCCVKALWSRPYFDKTRVGVHGTSYGGYSSAMLLLRYPDLFAAAAASSPVTAWERARVKPHNRAKRGSVSALVRWNAASTGRNFNEILRVIDSLQMTAKHRVATPADWQQGEDVIIAGSVSDDEAKTIYPQGWKAPKPYIRIVPQPK